MKRILITGATGFVGARVLERLGRELSYSIIVSVRASSNISYGRCSTVVVGNISSATEWSTALDGVDCVVHAAGRAHVLRDLCPNPLDEFREVNVAGTLNLAKQAIDAGVKRFIFISSIGVNGFHTSGKSFDESSLPEPQADYALSKLEAEQELRKLVYGSFMELVIIRPPLVYAGNAPGNFQRLLKMVASGVPLPFASISNQRSMVALENLVGFIVLCVEHPAAANELFLISDGVDVSTPEIIRNLAIGMGRKPCLISLPEVLMRWGALLIGKRAMYSQLCGSLAIDSCKARNLLGWQPAVLPADALQQAGRDYMALQTAKDGLK